MKDSYSAPYKIKEIIQETPSVKSFKIYSSKISKAKPGQYVLVRVFEPKELSDEIPISIASVGVREGYPYIELAVAEVGECTKAIHGKHVGDELGIRGPFGNGFSFYGDNFLLVGGGYGNAVLKSFAERTLMSGKNVTIAIGAKESSELLYKDRFKILGFDVFTATEDGSEGTKGLVTDLLPSLFEANAFDSVKTCGPELMMKKVLDYAKMHNIQGEASIDRMIKCGYGICGSSDL